MITIATNIDIAIIVGLSILFVENHFFNIDEFVSEYIHFNRIYQHITQLPFVRKLMIDDNEKIFQKSKYII